MNSGSEMNLQRVMVPQLTSVLVGGRWVIYQQDLLDFLESRGKLVTEQIMLRGAPLADTEFLRGQHFEQESIKHEIFNSTQVS